MARGIAGASRAGLAPDWPPSEGVAALLEAARELITRVAEAAKKLDPAGRAGVEAEIRRLEDRTGRLEGLLEA
jgi:hypothetical protein